MKKIKHSKFKNTGFLFEILTRQITLEILNNSPEKARKIVAEFFGNGTELSKELRLYKLLIDEKYNTESKAEKFIDAILEARTKLDEQKLIKEKYNLIKAIKETFEISRNSKIASSTDIYFIGVSIVFISCYFLSTNYDYRMVFLVPSLILLDKKVSGKISQNFFLTFLAISTLWLGSVYSGPRYFLQAAQFLGDISANLLVGVLVVYIIGCPNFSVFSSLNRALRNR